MPQLSTLTTEQLVQFKHHNQKLQQQLQREIAYAAGPTRIDRIQVLHNRVSKLLDRIYIEFERRAHAAASSSKNWPTSYTPSQTSS